MYDWREASGGGVQECAWCFDDPTTETRWVLRQTLGVGTCEKLALVFCCWKAFHAFEARKYRENGGQDGENNPTSVL